MEATLKFTLPEEDREFRVAQDGWKYRAIIEELGQWLRDDLKYNFEIEGAEAVLNKLYELCTEYHVEID